MERTARNEIRALSELDLAKLHFDISRSAQEAHSVYYFFRGALKRDDQIPFQCPCGKLGIVSRHALEKPPFKSFLRDGQLLCVECGAYRLDLMAPPPYTPLITGGIAELNKVFKKAIADNYMTLCYYLYSSLMSFQPRFHEVSAVCSHIYDIIARNVLLAQLNVDKIGQFKVNENDLRTEEVILQLMLINHVFELAELPDVLLTILSISEGEHFLIGDDGRSILPVGLCIKFDQGEQDKARKRMVHLRREIHDKNYFKLSRLIRKAFNPEVRNAFSHSEYRIEKEGVRLTGYNNRLVANQDLFEMFMAAYSIQEAIYTFIEAERQRFIASGGYEECGWRIEPIVEGNSFAVRIVGTSPACGPTGRVRRERAEKLRPRRSSDKS